MSQTQVATCTWYQIQNHQIMHIFLFTLIKFTKRKCRHVNFDNCLLFPFITLIMFAKIYIFLKKCKQFFKKHRMLKTDGKKTQTTFDQKGHLRSRLSELKKFLINKHTSTHTHLWYTHTHRLGYTWTHTQVYTWIYTDIHLGITHTDILMDTDVHLGYTEVHLGYTDIHMYSWYTNIGNLQQLLHNHRHTDEVWGSTI